MDHSVQEQLHGEVHAAEKEGLPQLDHQHFASQLFWLFVVFTVLYVFMAKGIIPRIRNVLARRQHQIQLDLDAAEKARNDAKTAQDTYESELVSAKTKATALVQKTQKEIDQFTSAEQQKLAGTLEALLQDSEQTLNAKRASARSEIAPMVEALTTQIAQTVLNEAPDVQDVQKAISKVGGAA